GSKAGAGFASSQASALTTSPTSVPAPARRAPKEIRLDGFPGTEPPPTFTSGEVAAAAPRTAATFVWVGTAPPATRTEEIAGAIRLCSGAEDTVPCSCPPAEGTWKRSLPRGSPSSSVTCGWVPPLLSGLPFSVWVLGGTTVGGGLLPKFRTSA